VLQQGIEQVDYLNLLLRQLTVPNEWMLGHHFNYLLTKNRFIMLKNHHYSKWALAKSVYVAPFIVLLLMLNCKHKSEENLISKDTIDGIPFDEYFNEGDTVYVTFTSGELEGEEFIYVKEEEPQRFVEEMPEYPGGNDAMYAFLSSNIIYPAQARADSISGLVFYEFVVGKDGSVSNVKVLSGVHPDLDAEGMRVLKMMPNWKPGKQNGAPVRCYYNIPVRFTIN
jgi:TonB family protein